MSWKKLGTTLLFPPRWLKVFLLILSFASLTTVMAAGLVLTHELALYYITIIYSIIVLTAYCIKEFPQKQKIVKKTLRKNKYAKLYIDDVTVRTRLSLWK